MRIIKLSSGPKGFKSEKDVVNFFRKDLPTRSPTGIFYVTRRKRKIADIQQGTLLLFSYGGHCMFIARSASPMKPSSDPKWPAYFVLNMSSLKKTDALLSDYERALRKETGQNNLNLVNNREWPLVSDSNEAFTLKFFGVRAFYNDHAPSKSAFAVADLGAPPPGNSSPDRADSRTWSYKRDPEVRDYVLKRAKGRCEHCRKIGFLLPDGGRYVETHHIIALAKDGPDTVRNVIGLCPNHHREAHYGTNAEKLERKLLKKLAAINAK
jgi:hypothetical protein